MSSFVVNKQGLNLTSSQHINLPQMKHESIIIPSTSAPTWGGYFVIDFRERNCILHDLVLQFNVSALTGYTATNGTSPRYTPAYFWFSRIELVQNNNVIDTIYPNQQFLSNQLFNFDEQRTIINLGCGAYNNTTQRATLAASANSYYVDLWNYFQQGHLPILSQKDDLQIRIYMDSLANNAVTGTATLTASPISTINSANLIARVTRLQSSDITNRLRSISARPEHYKFNELRYGTFAVNSGVSSTSIVLTPLTGQCNYLFFTVRPTASIVGDGYFSYTAISNFALLDGTSTNIVGGQAIPNAMALLYLGRDWSKSSYLSETALSTTNNNANVYIWSFSASCVETAETGVDMNTYKFTGNEQLQITFTGALAASVTIDVYAHMASVVEVSNNAVKKLSLQ
jgi:hypothetical protein